MEMAEGGMYPAEAGWRAYLDPDDVDVPLSCFRHTIKQRLGFYLNKEVATMTENDLCPDWGGLAELIGFDGLETDDIGRNANPGREVINRWIGKEAWNPTVGRLVDYLVRLEREDILTDLMSKIREEIRFHRSRHENFNNMEQPIQDETVSSYEMEREYNHILTIDDTMEAITIYDAFVCYEFRDINFVKEMIRRLEDGNGFRLFVPGRNNLVGTNSYELMTRLISERCRHMIVVLSNNFVQSEVCNFQSSYAFSLNPGARDKKMVPIKVEDCPIPETLRIMACCDFTNSDLLDWSWQRLAGSIMRPMPNHEFMGPEVWNPHHHHYHQLPLQQPLPSKMSSTVTPSSSSVPLLPLPASSLSASSSSSSLPSAGTSVAAPPGLVPSSLSRKAPGPSNIDSGFSSGFRSVQEPASPSQGQNLTQRASSSVGQDSHSKVKSNVSKALKQLTNFAASPKSRKKEKMKTTQF